MKIQSINANLACSHLQKQKTQLKQTSEPNTTTGDNLSFKGYWSPFQPSFNRVKEASKSEYGLEKIGRYFAGRFVKFIKKYTHERNLGFICVASKEEREALLKTVLLEAAKVERKMPFMTNAELRELRKFQESKEFDDLYSAIDTSDVPGWGAGSPC